MANINHRVGIKAKANEVYEALTTLKGLAGWWTKEVSGTPEKDKEIVFTFKTPKGDIMGQFRMKVLNQSPDVVEWQVNDGPPDWIGTQISFRLSQQDEYAILLFTHRNWKEETESMAHCSMKWGIFLMSLKNLVETGKGRPSPNDVKIDNWN